MDLVEWNGLTATSSHFSHPLPLTCFNSVSVNAFALVKYPAWILASISTRESSGIISTTRKKKVSDSPSLCLWGVWIFEWRDIPSGMGIRSRIGMPDSTMASCFMLDMESMRSILVTPSQWRMSGMSSWKRICVKGVRKLISKGEEGGEDSHLSHQRYSPSS